MAIRRKHPHADAQGAQKMHGLASADVASVVDALRHQQRISAVAIQAANAQMVTWVCFYVEPSSFHSKLA